VKVQTTKERVLTFWRFMSFRDPDWHSADRVTRLQASSPSVPYKTGAHSSANNKVTDKMAECGEKMALSSWSLRKTQIESRNFAEIFVSLNSRNFTFYFKFV
jgi:hypothetical protein